MSDRFQFRTEMKILWKNIFTIDNNCSEILSYDLISILQLHFIVWEIYNKLLFWSRNKNLHICNETAFPQHITFIKIFLKGYYNTKQSQF